MDSMLFCMLLSRGATQSVGMLSIPGLLLSSRSRMTTEREEEASI